MPLETESMFERIGGLELPARASLIANQSLAPLDPGRDLLLALFEAAINSELADAWRAATSGNSFYDNLLPVQDTLPCEPTEKLLTQRKTGFPLLAIHRSGSGRYEPHTLELTRLIQPWTLHYILGPLDAIDQRKLLDVCVAIAKIVALVIRRRGHASFEAGALQFFSVDAADPFRAPAFTSLRIVSHEGPGQAAFGGEASAVTYWAIEMALETTELSGHDSDAEGLLDGADFTVGVGGDDILPAMVLASTDDEA